MKYPQVVGSRYSQYKPFCRVCHRQFERTIPDPWIESAKRDTVCPECLEAIQQMNEREGGIKPEYKESANLGEGGYVCPKCGCPYRAMYALTLYNFCPDCGAKYA